MWDHDHPNPSTVFKLGSQLIQRGWRQQVKHHMLISFENCTSPKPKLPFIWTLPNCWYGWRSESCVWLIQVLLSGSPLLMGEDGLAAGLQLLVAASSQYFNSAWPATYSVVTEIAEAGMFSLNGSSALLLEPVSTWQLTLTPSYKENQDTQCSYGTDCSLGAKLWKKRETGVGKEVHLKMGSTSLLAPGPSSMSSVVTGAQLPSSWLYAFAFKPCVWMWFRVLKKNLVLWSQMVGAQGGQQREQAVHLAIQNEIRGLGSGSAGRRSSSPSVLSGRFPRRDGKACVIRLSW